MVDIASAGGLGMCGKQRGHSQEKEEVSETQHTQETRAIRGKKWSWKKSAKAKLHCFAKEYGLKGQGKNSEGF